MQVSPVVCHSTVGIQYMHWQYPIYEPPLKHRSHCEKKNLISFYTLILFLLLTSFSLYFFYIIEITKYMCLFMFGSLFSCNLISLVGRRPVLRVYQYTHQLRLGKTLIEMHYKCFQEKPKIIREAVLDVESFKWNFANISFQNEECFWNANLTPLDQYILKCCGSFMYHTEPEYIKEFNKEARD